MPFTLAAMQDMDALWGIRKVRTITPGTPLCHSGIVDSLSSLGDAAIWLKQDEAKFGFYDRRAMGDAAYKGKVPFRLILSPTRALTLADLHGQSIWKFLADHFPGNGHAEFNAELSTWLRTHGLDGIINVNGAEDDVAVASPGQKLEIVDKQPIADCDDE